MPQRRWRASRWIVDDEADLGSAARGRPDPRRWLRAALDLIVPPRCAACGVRVVEPSSLCGACWATLAFVERPFCEKTATPFTVDPGPGVLSPEALAADPPWERARAAALYVGAAPDLVRALKYGDRHEVAPLMARLMARAGRDVLAEADLIVPVPLHRWRLLQRRFNQAALVALALARSSGKPCRTDLLARRKPTPPQVGLGRDARARNVAGAFAVRAAKAEALAGRRVVLVDDVYTSGATLAAATRVLKRAGAARVDVLVFARVTDAIATA
jgi:ComF family protein